MPNRSDRTKSAILKALNDINGPAGASRILEKLSAMGVAIQPRTVRFYLLQLDREGMTRFVSRRRGRVITDVGREELSHANVMDKVGFVATKVDTLGYRMSFDCESGQGTVITNIALIDERGLEVALKEMKRVFEANLCMGTRLAVVEGGQKIGDVVIPQGMVGLGTICSVTMNGIMLHEGIPVTSRFGGLVEMRNSQPVRFVELIDYSGTTLDPLEAFIKAGMTQVRNCARTGDGIIGASFREIPSVALEDARALEKAMKRYGLGGILTIGRPNMPLLDIPVAEGRTGVIVVGGLNPIAALHEGGVRVHMMSLAGLEDFRSFRNFRELVPRNE